MRFRFIEDHRDEHPVRLMCRVLKVSPSGYHAWRSRPESARSAANRQVLADLRRRHARHRGRYGSPRLHAAPRAEGGTARRGRIERRRRRYDLRGVAARRFLPVATDHRRHGLPVAPDLLGRDFQAPGPLDRAAIKGLAERYLLHTHGRGLALSGRGARPDDPQGGGPARVC